MRTAALKRTAVYILPPILTGLALRLLTAFLLLGNLPLASDPASYRRIALELLDTGTFHKAFYYPPGQSLALVPFHALLGEDLWVTKLAMILISTASIALVFALSRMICGSDRGASVGAWIAALYLPAVMMSGHPYPHPLTGMLLLLTACFMMGGIKSGKAWWLALSGVSLGGACLTRPGTLSVLIGILLMGGLFILIPAHRLRDCALVGISKTSLAAGLALMCICLALTVLPVLGHNLGYGAGPVLSTNNERNFFLGNNRYTPLYKTSHLAERPRGSLPIETRDYLNRVANRPNRRQAFFHEAWSYIIANPGTSLLRCLNRFRAFWGFDYIMSREIQNNFGLNDIGLGLLLCLEAGGYVLVLLAAIWFVPETWGSGRIMPAFFLLGIVFSYQIPYCLAFSGGTYHFPIVPLLIALTASGVGHLASGRPQAQPFPKGGWMRWLTALMFLAIQVEYAVFAALMREKYLL